MYMSLKCVELGRTEGSDNYSPVSQNNPKPHSEYPVYCLTFFKICLECNCKCRQAYRYVTEDINRYNIMDVKKLYKSFIGAVLHCYDRLRIQQGFLSKTHFGFYAGGRSLVHVHLLSEQEKGIFLICASDREAEHLDQHFL